MVDMFPKYPQAQCQEVVPRRLPGCPDRGGGRTTPSPTRKRNVSVDKVLLAIFIPGRWFVQGLFKGCRPCRRPQEEKLLAVCQIFLPGKSSVEVSLSLSLELNCDSKSAVPPLLHSQTHREVGLNR